MKISGAFKVAGGGGVVNLFQESTFPDTHLNLSVCYCTAGYHQTRLNNGASLCMGYFGFVFEWSAALALHHYEWQAVKCRGEHGSLGDPGPH